MIPHERSLVEKLKDKPFVLLGVNADFTLDAMKKIVKKEKVNWRSWFDGDGNKIAKLYRVSGYPTIYVLDHKGVIRFKDLREEELDKAIDLLIKEVPTASSGRSN